MAQHTTVDGYIASLPTDARATLQAAREAVHRGCDGLGERMSYGIATFTLAGSPLLYLGGWKRHVGIYPIPTDDEVLEPELSRYRSTKDTLRIPLDEPPPIELIERITAMLVRRRGESSA